MPRNKPLSLWKPDQKMITTQQQFIHAQIKNIGQAKLSTLVSKATEAQALSYSPYSKYQVGAAILTVSGDIYQGTNIERASYLQRHLGRQAHDESAENN